MAPLADDQGAIRRLQTACTVSRMAISPLSVRSHLLTPEWENKALASATGFIVVHGDGLYLITNWHVASGRNVESGEALSSHGVTPDSIQIRYLPLLPQENMGQSYFTERLLTDDGEPRWLEHPRYRRRVDVVALRLTQLKNTLVQPYDLNPPSRLLRATVSDSVNIIGFPFGVSVATYLAIWARGSIASEPEIDFDELPCFLVDSRTRQGQSGSPVVAYSPGGPTIMANGSLAMASQPMVNLLGVYSGRINAESDLGKVWKVRAIQEIIEGDTLGSNAEVM